MTSRVRRSHRLAVVSLAGLLLGSVVPLNSVHAADPVPEAKREMVREHGGSAEDFELVYERSASPHPDGGALWAGKLVDRRTGEIHAMYRANDGMVGGGLLDDAVREASAPLSALERKADAPLRAAVNETAVDATAVESLPVAIWLEADVSGAEAAVRDRHPEVEWLAGRPVADTLEQARALRAELWEARSAVYASAADALRADIKAAGGDVAYVSSSAPLLFVDLPPASVGRLAARADVLSLGLEQEWRTSMTSAGPTVTSNWTGGSDDQGNGVRVAVVEYHNVSTSGDLAGQVVSSYSTTGTIATHSHPTWVAGAIASRSTTWAGVAPGADIVSASTGGYTPSVSTDRAIIAAADWAVAPGGGDADIVNASIGQDTATGAEEARRYFDSIVWEDGRLVVAASGNYTTFGNWDVVSPGTGYNVLTVGGMNDRNSAGRADDLVWYVPGSNGAAYRDRTDASWNTHGDYNKPNLSAPAVSVRTANGTAGDGTSVASPIVAGIAAQLIARVPSLVAWPEATRAILTAGALYRTRMPDGSLNADHEGSGTASALWANRVLANGPYGGYAIGAMRAGQTVVREVPIVRGQSVRVALAWSSHTSGTSNTGKADTLMSDLDLRVVSANGAVVGSFSFDNPYEVVDFVAPATGTMRIEVRHERFDAAEEPYALAWALTSPFSDVDGSPFYADILWIAQRAITNGCGAGRYCPADMVARDQMASFLVRALKLPATTTDYFDDDESSQHEADINSLAAAAITIGCSERRYCPSDGVTRAEMATFLVRALKLPATSTDYFDDDDSSIHHGAINALAAAGVTNGCGNGHYCPGSMVMRDQMAAFLRRALD